MPARRERVIRAGLRSVVALFVVLAGACSEDPASGISAGGEAPTSTAASFSEGDASCEIETEDVCAEEGLTEALNPAGDGVDPAEALAAGCANVIGVSVAATGGTFRFDVTVRSADTGPEKYADAWEVRAPDGTVLGVRELLHDHVNEQPFTRSLTGVEIPSGIEEVTVAARDSVVGFCGVQAVAAVPRG